MPVKINTAVAVVDIEFGKSSPWLSCPWPALWLLFMSTYPANKATNNWSIACGLGSA